MNKSLSLVLTMVFAAVSKKKILSTTALLSRVTRQVRAYSAKSLKGDAVKSIPKIFSDHRLEFLLL